MDVFKEEFNPGNVDLAFEAGAVFPRVTLSIRKSGIYYRFVRDIVSRTINGLTFEPLPYMRFGELTSLTGRVSDSVIITLDAIDLVNGASEEVKTAFQNVVALPLRGAAMQLGTMTLDPVSMQPTGLKADYCGLINGIEYDEEDREVGPKLEVECLSFLTVAKSQPVRRYTDVDHQQIHPGDDSFKALSDVVARQSVFVWNQKKDGSREPGSSGGSGLGGAIRRAVTQVTSR